MLLFCMICPARTRVAVTLADLRFFLPSASGRDGRIGCIERCIVRSADRRGSPGGPGFGQWSPGPPDLCDLRSAERRPLTTGHWPLFSRHSPLPGRHSLRATNRLAKIGFVCWIPHYFVISPDLETTNT